LLTVDVGSVRVLTMNRPEVRNALSGELISALYAGLVDADTDPDVHAVVLTGADPAFCAGVDLEQAASEGEAYFRRYRDEPCIQQVARMATPVIGAINGATFTGGLEIALGCDFLVASERAVFADTHAHVGVLPGGGMTARLPGVVGQAWARRLSFTGEVVDAAEALRIGLVTEVVAHDALLTRAIGLATAISEVPPTTMRTLKRIYREGGEPIIGAALAVEQAISNANRPDLVGLEDRRRAVTARNRDQL
jgi:enoyl-CoA hydratase/carnithine racemase